MYQAIYDSPWHSPVLFWALGGLFLLALARRLPFLAGYGVLFTVCVFADVLVTGALSPLGASPWAGRLAILFVLLGDLRFFLLLERFARQPDPRRRTPPGAWLAASALTLVVPLLANAPRLLPLPGVYAEPRRLFLIYEILFALLAAGLLFWGAHRRATDAALQRWLRGAIVFELLQYAGWALADAAILGGWPVGHLLRLAPNVMYYGLFLPFVHFTAPAAVREAA